MYLQPVKHDDPQLDFYTMYKRETTDYDTAYMQKYNEDLNTTLIFVSSCVLYHSTALTTLSGWSFLCCQLCFRRRRPVKPPARSQRTIRSLPPRNPPQSQSIHCSRRKALRPSSVEWSSWRNRHNLGPSVRKPSHVTTGRIRRDVGQAVVEPVPSTRGRIDGRTVWRPPAQI